MGWSEAQLEGSEAQLERFEAQLERFEGQLVGSGGQLEGSEVQLEGLEAQLEGSEAQLEGFDGQPRGGQINRQFDGKSPHSTGFCPLSRPLPKKCLKGPRRASNGLGVSLKALEPQKPTQEALRKPSRPSPRKV